MSLGITFSVNIQGLKNWLSSIEVRSPQTLQEFLRGASDIAYEELEKTTPKRSSYLWYSTITQQDEKSVLVKPTAFYAAFVESGTAPHIIRPKSPDGVLRFEIGGEVIFAKYVNHPGTRPTFLVKTAREATAKRVALLALEVYKKLYGAKS